MRVRYLDSRAVETIPEALAAAAARAKEMDVAMAFLTKAGTEQISNLVGRLRRPHKRQQVRVLAGVWLGISDPSALRKIHRMKGVCLRIAKRPGFHVKHLSLHGGGRVTAFTGSANFTAKGLGGEGELLVEISDKPGSEFEIGERDAFRRMWEEAYPEAITKEIIDAYASGWKRPTWLPKEGLRPGNKLLGRFGRTTDPVAKRSDGSVLWLPILGSLSEPTVKTLERIDRRGDDFIGLGKKSIFDRIQDGTRAVWALDRRGRPGQRRLDLHDIIRWVNMPTDDDGRYFAILTRSRRSIRLNAGNRQQLKTMGLIARVDSLASKQRVLRPGRDSVIAKLRTLSTGRRRQ